MWKFQNFSTSQFLREINFWDYRSSKNCYFDIFEPLKFDFDNFLQFLSSTNWPKVEFRASESAKMPVFELLESSKLISRKI